MDLNILQVHACHMIGSSNIINDNFYKQQLLGNMKIILIRNILNTHRTPLLGESVGDHLFSFRYLS